MTPLEIKIEFLKRGITQQDIARKCGVSRTMVYMCTAKRLKSKNVMREISRVLEKPLHVIWPDLFKEGSE